MYAMYTSRGRAVWQLVGLITRRSEVQISPPPPIKSSFTAAFFLTSIIFSDQKYFQKTAGNDRKSLKKRKNSPGVTKSLTNIIKIICLILIYNQDLPSGNNIRLIMKLSYFDRININSEEISSKYGFYKSPTRLYISYI